MSSIEYSATLTPDPWLRTIVFRSGQFMALLGVVLILLLPLAVPWRLGGVLAWVFFCRAEWRKLEQSIATIVAIRVLGDGSAAVLTDRGEWVAATLLDGSMLLQKLAWLRLQSASGQMFLELISGDSRKDHDWRRLQVIWRHIGAGP